MRVLRQVAVKPKYFLLFLCFALGSAVLICQIPRAAAAGVDGASGPEARGTLNGKIVFVSDRHTGRGLNIWTMNPDGSAPTRLPDGKSRTDRLPPFVPVYDGDPAWSPDGSKIAFISNRDYLFGLYTMNADGSNVKLVTDQVPDPSGPSWSPDGQKIACAAGNGIVIEPNQPVIDIY